MSAPHQNLDHPKAVLPKLVGSFTSDLKKLLRIDTHPQFISSWQGKIAELQTAWCLLCCLRGWGHVQWISQRHLSLQAVMSLSSQVQEGDKQYTKMVHWYIAWLSSLTTQVRIWYIKHIHIYNINIYNIYTHVIHGDSMYNEISCINCSTSLYFSVSTSGNFSNVPSSCSQSSSQATTPQGLAFTNLRPKLDRNSYHPWDW